MMTARPAFVGCTVWSSVTIPAEMHAAPLISRPELRVPLTTCVLSPDAQKGMRATFVAYG
jgi:hypothetical protein